MISLSMKLRSYFTRMIYLLCILTISGCCNFQCNKLIEEEKEYYNFSAHSIERDIYDQRLDTFSLSDGNNSVQDNYSVYYGWTTYTYSSISEFFLSSNQKLDIKKWQIKSVLYESSCYDLDYGIGSATIQYYLEDFSKLHSNREIKTVKIISSKNLIIYKDAKYNNLQSPLKSIEFAKVKINPIQALTIVRENGLNPFLEKIGYDCNYQISLDRNDGTHAWHIKFTSSPDDDILLDVHVDYGSGKISIIQNLPLSNQDQG
jgi:hypothetical protein